MTCRRICGCLSLLLAAVLILTGCGRSGAGGGGRDGQQALAALMGYLDGRRANTLPAAYDHLSAESRQLFTREEFVQYYGEFPTLQWKRVGDVNLIAPDWARIVVYDIETAQGVLPDFAYHVHKVDGRWGVAVINPVLGRLGDLAPEKQGAFRRKLLAADPYHFGLHRELLAIYLQEGEFEQAGAMLDRLYRLSTPSALAAIQVDRAKFFLAVDQPARALPFIEKALALSEAYPERYDPPWRSGVLVDKARALAFSGQMPEAAVTLEEAVQINPDNQEAQVMLHNIKQFLP